jgi:UTP--glucose-1-phosphate uridylyltransferase
MSNMINKAIITTAGFGTRLLPISKTIQKEMLPVLNRPLVDYVVEDLVKAGVTEIIFVINEHNIQIKHYYSQNLRLYEYLKEMNKVAAYDQVSHIHDQAKFTFIEQPDSEQYGTAVPVKLCEDLLKNEEAFFVFMGDVFTYGKNGRSEAKEMAELFNKSQGGGVASFIERPENELHKYGIAEIEEKNDIKYLKNIVEKPAPGEAPSNLSNTSQYILTPAAFKIIENQAVDPKSGELYITDTVKEIAKQSGIAVHIPQNEFLDGGSVKSWLKANLTVAWDNPELKKELREFISKLD